MIEKRMVEDLNLLHKYKQIMTQVEPIRSLGLVQEIVGSIIYAKGPDVKLGELCHIEKIESGEMILAEVVGFKDNLVVLSPLAPITGISPGAKVLSTGAEQTIRINDEILGRVINAIGQPLDSKGKLISDDSYSLNRKGPSPLERPLIRKKLETGVKAIDAFLTIGQGQRVGIFSGSGVGKSTLMGMLARYSNADVNVVGLIGERGREVKEFIEEELGEEGLAKSVIVVSTSDESAMNRVKAAYLTTTIAEYFRDKGKNVLLLMDSLTRLAMAQREVGLAAGEPATTKGYPPSVFGILPALLERAGTNLTGSITGIYTVLVEGDDLNDPIADTARGILDGHIILSRRLAQKNHYPCIEITESISRLMTKIADENHKQLAAQLREILSVYRENEEIISLGAYVKGSNTKIDKAISIIDQINSFLKQDMLEFVSFSDTVAELNRLLGIKTAKTSAKVDVIRRAG